MARLYSNVPVGSENRQYQKLKQLNGIQPYSIVSFSDMSILSLSHKCLNPSITQLEKDNLMIMVSGMDICTNKTFIIRGHH